MAIIQTVYKQVYYVETTNPDRPINLIAIRPTISGNHISWEDTSRGTSFEAKKITVEKKTNEPFPEKIIISLEDGEKITLTKLISNVYNEKVRPWVAGKIAFKSDDELQEYYLNTLFGF